MLIAGLSEGSRSGAAALADGERLVGVCAQERVTRVRAEGSDEGLPLAALELLMNRLGRPLTEIGRTVVASRHAVAGTAADAARLDRHRALACTTFLTSPFDEAAVVVCDRDYPKVSVWKGQGTGVTPLDWPWAGDGFSDVYSRLTTCFGFSTSAGDLRLEALARLAPDDRDANFERQLRLDQGRLIIAPDFDGSVADRVGRAQDIPRRAGIASALQNRLGDLLVEFLTLVREQMSVDRLCLGGAFFYHSSMNTRAKQSGLFGDVYVPPDPGSRGMAVGAALAACSTRPALASPFMGPAFSAQETKEVLDNCKLQYDWVSEGEAIGTTVKALGEGRLVGWFTGGMEWGPRSLGARCILANPLAPYVLENLNRFLKKREAWRGYALSGTLEALEDHFAGPSASPFMECDYRPRDPERFRHVLPDLSAAMRVHSVARDSHPLFRRLLEAVGDATGVPFVVNTSFNGFHEPIVCSPRDAVRVFYGSGLDLLVMNQFLVRK